MPQLLPGDTKPEPRKPQPPGSGGKGLDNRPPLPETSPEKFVRQDAARDIAHRTAQFNLGTVQKHPHTVAGLVRSSLSTEKLTHVARNLDEAYEHVVARNAVTQFQHDPDRVNPTYAPTEDEETLLEQEELKIRMELAAAETFQEKIAILGGPSRYPGLTPDDRIRIAAENRIKWGGNPFAAAAAGFQAPFSVVFRGAGSALDWAGDTLDDIPVVGKALAAPIRAPHAVVDVTLGALEQNAARAGRLLGDVPAAGAMAVSEIRNREGDVDTDWGALLDFWRLERHDPVTTGVANVMGYDVNDPKFAETAQSIDIIAGVVEQIALAKVMVGIHGKLTIPGETGDGLLHARTWVDHHILNGGMFNKLADLYEGSPPSLHVGRTLASTRRLSPRLAKAFSDAYRIPGTRAAKIAAMKQVFVDLIENNTDRATARLRAANEGLAANPGDVVLKAEKAAAESTLETIAAHEPVEAWPRYQDVRGMLKGAPSVTRGGKFIKAFYERRPFKAVTDVTKTVDNVRSKPRLYAFDSRRVVADSMRQNAQNASRWLRDARVPEPVISRLLGEMTEGVPFDEWFKHVTEAAKEHTATWANPVQVNQLVRAMENAEVFTNRSNYTTYAADGGEVRRPIIEKANGTTPPTQLNEFANGADLPDVSLVHDTTAAISRVKLNPTVNWFSRQWNNVMAGWRAQTIFSRGPAITLTIQAEEGIMRFFTNTTQQGRLGNWLVHKLPVNPEVQAAVTERLGLTDVDEARRQYAEMKKHPEMLGQTMGEVAAEKSLRIEAPTKRFKSDFLNGTIDVTSKEAKDVFADWVWEMEHTATSADTRALLSYGPERTARLMVGEGGIGEAPIPEGTVRLTSLRRHINTPEALERIRREGLKQGAGTTEGRPAVFGSDDMEGHAANLVRNGALEPTEAVVEYWMNEAELRREGVGSSAIAHGDVPPERIVRIWEGGKGSPTPSPELERMGRHIIETTETDPSYAGLAPRDRVVEFLTRKEDTLARLAGGNPEALDLMSSGRTRKFRLQDPNGELDLVQDELEQLHLTHADPELAPGTRLSLVERRLKLLDSAEEHTTSRRLQISKNNTAIRDWLMNEASEGRYEMPEYRRTLMTKSGYETAEGLHRGLISRVQRVQYGAMKFMNRDAMRAGFAEQSYTKWYKRYRGLGWTETQASKAAVAQAMFEARDWLHDIGTKSSFQRFFRNEAPFYHAWERVAYRWLVKAPNMMGAGFTPLGWGIESNIVHGTMAALKQLNIIQETKNPDGTTSLHTYLPNPVQLLNWIPGIKAPDRIDIFNPETVLFPPLHLLSHPPGLAPQTLYALSAAADLTHISWLKQFHEEVTMNGAFSLQFPGSGQATKIWEVVTGDVPPWAIGKSKNYQEYIIGRSRDAALRYAYTELVTRKDPPPNPAEFDTRAEYVAARDTWWSRWTALADEYHTGLSITNLLAVESPLTSFKPTTQEEVAWKQFLQENHLMGERDEDDWALIDDYLSDHPESLAYNVGMYTEDSKWPKDEGYEAFKKNVSNGNIKLLDEDDFRSKLALAHEWEYKNKADAIALQKAGLSGWHTWSASKKLLHYGEYIDATRPSWDNFNEFLDEDPVARKLYDENRSDVSLLNDRIQQARQDLSYDPSNRELDKRLQGLYEKRADITEYGTTSTDHMRWYRNVVMNDYYTATNDIYDRIDVLEKSGSPAADEAVSREYDKLRRLNTTWPSITGPDGKAYPSPEAYLFASKPKTEQTQQRVKWAAVPPSWLSQFQYETTYGKADGKVKAYFNAEEQVSDYFDDKTKKMSHSSNEYEAWVKWRDTSMDILAKRNGTTEIRRLEKAPKIARLAAAGLLPDSEGMNWIVDQSQAIATRLVAKGSTQWSSSEDAQYYRGWLESYIAKMRDPQSGIYDARVDRFFTRQAYQTGLTYDPALYRYVLFGLTGTFELDIDYSAEDKAATA